MLQFSRSTIKRAIKPVVFVLSLVPFSLLVYAAVTDSLGANPVEALTHQTGLWGLYFLLITLSITPLKKITGMTWPVSLRRMLGLFAFFYACLHLTVYFWLDQSLLWQDIIEDIVKRPYITLGLSAWLLLLPLALTSNQFSMRLLKKNWKRLHRLVYIAALLVVVHFIWLVKADYTEPLMYLGILLFLLLTRTRIFKWST
ncbi:MAG: sulfoxide reductase heme-binding subunit YedZ [Gammaproteobacteria bacterium]|nr:sulfoxide reductase heme-binding subunit YedZ [Gammaproteobacteria bacterium]